MNARDGKMHVQPFKQSVIIDGVNSLHNRIWTYDVFKWWRHAEVSLVVSNVSCIQIMNAWSVLVELVAYEMPLQSKSRMYFVNINFT